MTIGDLTVLGNALAWLNLPADDSAGTIARLISAVSDQIQNVISRTIISTSYTGVFNGNGSNRLMLPNYPITAISSVQVWTQVIPARVFGSVGGFSFDNNTVYLDPPYRFDRGAQNVQIAYTAGYASVPHDIEQACLDLIKVNYVGRRRAANLSLQRAGEHEERFDLDTTKLNRGVVPIPPAIFSKLQQYIRVYPA